MSIHLFNQLLNPIVKYYLDQIHRRHVDYLELRRIHQQRAAGYLELRRIHQQREADYLDNLRRIHQQREADYLDQLRQIHRRKADYLGL